MFDVLHERRQRVRRAQTDEQMNVVSRAANGFGNPVRRANRAAEIFMQAPAPFIRDDVLLWLRSESKG